MGEMSSDERAETVEVGDWRENEEREVVGRADRVERD
jgi:hypothetical protein